MENFAPIGLYFGKFSAVLTKLNACVEKNPKVQLNEVLFGSSDKRISAQLSRLQKQGLIRKIAPRIYTPNLKDPAEAILRRQLFWVLERLFPGALLSHRSAFEVRPTEKGNIYITYKYTKKITLPGVTIHLLEGPPATEGDRPLIGQLYLAQPARAFLENLQLSRRRGAESKVLSRTAIEGKLEEIVRVQGEEQLNLLRDQARVLAEQLGMHEEFDQLNTLIRALLRTHHAAVLSNPLAAARAFGLPYDPHRLRLFEELFRVLHNRSFPSRPNRNTSQGSFENFAFFESYFSNYIEGTVFGIDEARQIIATNQPMLARKEDSHDVLGTYKIVSDYLEMSRTPGNGDELLALLKTRHALLMAARPDKKPGQFKDRNNYAGQTAFVDYLLVRGTLIKGYDLYQALSHPFARAAYLMFLVAEVHPFLDGNGRIARIMMNAELVAAGQTKIIIPNVYREDYLGVLRKLTRKSEPLPYVQMLERAWEFSAQLQGDDFDATQAYLHACDAFLEPAEGKLKIMPRE